MGSVQIELAFPHLPSATKMYCLVVQAAKQSKNNRFSWHFLYIQHVDEYEIIPRKILQIIAVDSQQLTVCIIKSKQLSIRASHLINVFWYFWPPHMNQYFLYMLHNISGQNSNIHRSLKPTDNPQIFCQPLGNNLLTVKPFARDANKQHCQMVCVSYIFPDKLPF